MKYVAGARDRAGIDRPSLFGPIAAGKIDRAAERGLEMGGAAIGMIGEERQPPAFVVMKEFPAVL